MRASLDPRRERWVREKGLPRTCRDPVAAHFGQQLLLATDLTSSSRRAEQRAMRIAEDRGARLLILAVGSQAANDWDAHGRLEALARDAQRRGIDATVRLMAGDPGEGILHAAAAFGADGIVMGAAHGRPAAGCPCGHVVLRARCPVLVTHAG